MRKKALARSGGMEMVKETPNSGQDQWPGQPIPMAVRKENTGEKESA